MDRNPILEWLNQNKTIFFSLFQGALIQTKELKDAAVEMRVYLFIKRGKIITKMMNDY